MTHCRQLVRLAALLHDVGHGPFSHAAEELLPWRDSDAQVRFKHWDIERKRYPQYDHTAVIVAEHITARFLNVVSLFNGMIPLVAIQMSALKMGNQVGLVFTTVLDQMTLGLVDEDEEVQEVTDRNYWERRGSQTTVAMADELLEIVRTLEPGLELKYNKFYIGLAKNGQPCNFVVLRMLESLSRRKWP